MYKPAFIIDIRRKVYYLAWYDGLAEMRKVANNEHIIAAKSIPGEFILDGGYRMVRYYTDKAIVYNGYRYVLYP